MSLLGLFKRKQKWRIRYTPMFDEGPGVLAAVRDTKRRILYINSNTPTETQARMLANFKGDYGTAVHITTE